MTDGEGLAAARYQPVKPETEVIRDRPAIPDEETAEDTAKLATPGRRTAML